MTEEPRQLPDEVREKYLAEARRAAAEAEKAAAEARKLTAEAEKVESELAVVHISQRKAERAEREEMTALKYFHVYNYTSAVSEATVKNCMEQLNIWHRLEPGCDIEVIFTSPGGTVIEGMVLFDYLQMLQREGHAVTTGTFGWAASMAGILLQAGTTRWMGKEAWLLIHEGSFGAAGSMGQVEDTVEWVKKVQNRILDIYAARAKVSRAFIKRNWRRKDWWLSSSECEKYGFVDQVR